MKIAIFTIGALSFLLAAAILCRGVIFFFDGDKEKGKSGTLGGILFLVCSFFTMMLSPSFTPSNKNVTTYEISITAEDGRIICNYEDTSNIALDRAHREIKFEDKDHHKQIIVYGTQDTVTIIEN